MKFVLTNEPTMQLHVLAGLVEWRSGKLFSLGISTVSWFAIINMFSSSILWFICELYAIASELSGKVEDSDQIGPNWLAILLRV